MRYFYILFCALLCGITASAQEKISLKDVENYVGKEVTICAQVAQFDSRADHIYLYFGEQMKKQKLTIIINRNSGPKPIKIKMPVLLSREIACYTGTITRYSGPPDTTANFGIAEIKKEVERDRLMMIGGELMNAHVPYIERTGAIDLQGMLVMIITDQKQISKKTERAKVSFY